VCVEAAHKLNARVVTLYDSDIRQMPIQALPQQCRNLDFGHVQPDAMHRRVMELQFGVRALALSGGAGR